MSQVSPILKLGLINRVLRLVMRNETKLRLIDTINNAASQDELAQLDADILEWEYLNEIEVI